MAGPGCNPKPLSSDGTSSSNQHSGLDSSHESLELVFISVGSVIPIRHDLDLNALKIGTRVLLVLLDNDPCFCFSFLLVRWVCFAIAARQRVHILCFIELGGLLVRPDPPPLSYSVSSYFGTSYRRLVHFLLSDSVTRPRRRHHRVCILPLCEQVDRELRPLRSVLT
jgi:hypothetical protein